MAVRDAISSFRCSTPHACFTTAILPCVHDDDDSRASCATDTETRLTIDSGLRTFTARYDSARPPPSSDVSLRARVVPSSIPAHPTSHPQHAPHAHLRTPEAPPLSLHAMNGQASATALVNGQAPAKMWGITPSISLAPPTAREAEVTRTLIDELHKQGCYESAEEGKLR